MSIDFIRTQSPIGGGSGGGFLADPFLELNSAITTPTIQKTNKSDLACVSNGALAGSIIGTLILSAFIGFLTWLIYLRPKFQELRYKQLQENRRIKQQKFTPISNYKQRIDDGFNHHHQTQLPLDVTDYKFGTFPFRQSQTSSINGHYNPNDWLNRMSSSFRSVNMDQDFEMIDIELFEPTFSGLNFSITGNMRAGIFVKDIIDEGQIKINSSNQLKTGDRIMALTVCFESIVYEDALTILSYASPYPVILRIQRPIDHHTKINVTREKRPILTNKVKWRDDFEHYDNDTQNSRSFILPNPPPPPPPPPLSRPTNSKISSSTKKSRPISNTQPRHNNKSSTINKTNKLKTISTSVLATSGATTKRSNNDIKKSRTKTIYTQRPILAATGLTSKTLPPPPPTPSISNNNNNNNNKKTVKSVTDAVISYLHYKGNGTIEQTSEMINHSEAAMMPYYDSPYDYYYDGQISQYQYLHQSHLNKNNNNSLSAETLTAVTPNLATSIYTLQLSSIKSSHPISRQYQRRLSLPSILAITKVKNENSIQNMDTFV